MIEAFFLTDGGPDLLVTYHPPTGAFVEQITVICPPFFGECQRTQLSLRELAIALAAQGHHVIRFDYRGSGDSFGEAASLADWSQDIDRVVAEARDVSGCERINIIAVRAAALLMPAWTARAQQIGRIVLWDPVWNGARYLEQYAAYRAASNFRNRWLSSAERNATRAELLGFPLHASLQADIVATDHHQWAAPAGTVAIYTTQPPNDPPNTEAKQVRFECRWEKYSDDILMPGPVLEELRECLIKP